MKPTFLLTLFFILLNNLADAQDTTFVETEAWLNGKLGNNFGDYKVKGYQYTYEYKTTIKDCSCVAIVSSTFNNKRTSDYSQYKFNFKDVIETSVVPIDGNKSLFAILKLNGKGKVFDQIVFLNENGKQVERVLKSSFSIKFATNELSIRVQKGIDEYIKLCKEKKEKF
jgi:hypothetical protein